jgi:hypothetical protein
MQIEIVKLAYEDRDKVAQLKELLDTKSVLVYNINRLESAYNLGHNLLSSNTDLQFTTENQIVSLNMPIRLTESEKTNSTNLMRQKNNFFFGLFSLKSQAEATEKIK